MKSTIIMLSCIATFITTWMFVTTIGYLLSENISFREAASHDGVLMSMVIFGWIPSLILGVDLNEKFDN